MDILFADKDIIVVLKPAGLACEGAQPNAVSLLSEQTGREIFPVHRLDKDTAGVMVFAANRKAAAKLSESIREGGITKKYYAAVHGLLDEKEGIMEDLLFHDRQKNKTFIAKKERSGVKAAKLSYSIKDEKNGFSLAEITLFTGRTHQIRVQFASRGHSLIGDGKYGGGAGKPALFAFSLEFPHPSTGKKMLFTSAPNTSEHPWSIFDFGQSE